MRFPEGHFPPASIIIQKREKEAGDVSFSIHAVLERIDLYRKTILFSSIPDIR
jgi:hypothetical protein